MDVSAGVVGDEGRGVGEGDGDGDGDGEVSAARHNKCNAASDGVAVLAVEAGRREERERKR